MAIDHSKQKPILKAASACVWSKDSVLLIKRASALGYGRWSLPGGKQEPGEPDIETAHRELTEETGITADLIHDLGIFHIDVGDVIYAIHSFAGLYIAGQAQAASDASDIAWVNHRELNTFNLTPNILDAVALARKLISV
jgi:8-oxo-dGTP diphosphatase